MAATSKKLVNSGVMRLVALALAGALALIAAYIWFTAEPWVETVSERAADLRARTTTEEVGACIQQRIDDINQLVRQDETTRFEAANARADAEATCKARGPGVNTGDRVLEQTTQDIQATQ